MGRIIGLSVLILMGCSDAGGGSPPRLNPVDPQRVLVGEKLTVLITATDPDGDELTFKIAGRPQEAQFVALDDGESALFTWTPEVTDTEPGGKDYAVEFFVEDDTGQWDSKEVIVTVVPQNAPAFVNPPGYVLDLAELNNIEFVATVKDDSASHVDIVVEQGPEGYYLEQTGKKQAYFYWRPTKEQIHAKQFWYVRFKASGYAPDPNLPGQEFKLYELIHDIAIVITNADYGGCPGSPPNIQHTVLGDQHWEAAMGSGYRVEAKIVENDSYLEQGSVMWTTSNPQNDQNYIMTKMSQDSGTAYSGIIPKVQAGSGQFVHYYIEAWDNDDQGGTTCDHMVRFPKSGYFTFVAYDEGWEMACLEDNYEDNDSFDTTVFFEEPGEVNGLRICGDDQDFLGFGVFAKAVEVTVLAYGNEDALATQILDGMGNPVASLEYGSMSASIPGEKLAGNMLVLHLYSTTGEPVTYSINATLQNEACEADELEFNDTAVSAPLVGEGQFDGLTLCAGDIDYYRLEVPTGTHLKGTIVHKATEGDLDLYLLSADGEAILTGAETSSDNESIQFNVVQGGTHYLLVKGFSGSTNSYNLVVEYSSQTESCLEDSFAPNQYQDEAVMNPPSEFKQLIACPKKADWFKIGLNGGETIAIDVVSDSNLSLKLYGKDGLAVLCNGAAGGGSVGLSCPIPEPGNYAYVIDNPGSLAVLYDLIVAVTEDMGTCHEDRFEPNNIPSQGAPIVGSTITWLKACGQDEDWFNFEGNTMDYVFIGILFDPTLGYVDVSLYDSEGYTVLASSDSKAGKPYLEYNVAQQGTYQVKVKGEASAGNVPYNLFMALD